MAVKRRTKKERGFNGSIFIKSEYFDTWDEIEKESEKAGVGVGSFLCRKWEEWKKIELAQEEE